MELAEHRASVSARATSCPPIEVVGPSPLTVLAREALGKHPEKVRSFLEAIAPTVRRVCRGVLGHAHPDLEDAIQESLIDLMQALPKYRFEADVSHYAAKIALRVAISERSKDRARVERLHVLHQNHGTPLTAQDPTNIVAEVESSWLIRLIIRKLRRSQTEAVLLRIVLGCSVEEIATITGVPLNTAKTRLRIGKDNLRRYLEKQGYAPGSAEVLR